MTSGCGMEGWEVWPAAGDSEARRHNAGKLPGPHGAGHPVQRSRGLGGDVCESLCPWDSSEWLGRGCVQS